MVVASQVVMSPCQHMALSRRPGLKWYVGYKESLKQFEFQNLNGIFEISDLGAIRA